MSNHLKRKVRTVIKEERRLDYQEVERIVNATVGNTVTYILWALRNKWGFGGKRLLRVVDDYNAVVNDRADELFTARDIREQLALECPELKCLFEGVDKVSRKC